jgi:dynein heavy chain
LKDAGKAGNWVMF